MLFKTCVSFWIASALAAAVPTPQDLTAAIPPDAEFGLIALHSASPVHLSTITVCGNSFFVGPKTFRNETCDYGTFKIEDTSAFVVNGETPRPQLFVDRSGMGQGRVGFVPEGSPIGRYWEQKPFAINDSNFFQFAGIGWLACPIEPNAYELWLDVVEKPAGIEGCVWISLMAITAATTPTS